MEHDYQNIISHIDVDRSIDAIEYFDYHSANESKILEFKDDIEGNNDTIELHLIKSRSYKDSLVLHLKKSNEYKALWREFLREEQKTFGGSKIFYMDKECSKLLILSVADELKNKLNMVVTRLNKVNEKITRINNKIKKDNFELYESRIKNKESNNKNKDEVINFINQNLRV